MRIEGIIWLEDIVEKLWRKHRVVESEVEGVLQNRPRFRFIEKGRRPGEDVYAAVGSYAEIGQYWDEHDLGEVWDRTEPADFEVELKS